VKFAIAVFEPQAKTLRIKGYWRKNKQRHLNDVSYFPEKFFYLMTFTFRIQ
jgi:hypothetical protein